ncbi:MAG: hypothetical protein QOG46_278 [Pseudonocardiales bacterium]|nr:hypothetical protein [Pseudonocardiales bacterium]
MLRCGSFKGACPWQRYVRGAPAPKRASAATLTFSEQRENYSAVLKKINRFYFLDGIPATKSSLHVTSRDYAPPAI